MQNSYYTKLGGDEAINIAVDLFYEKMLADPLVAPFFENVNIDEIKKHQRAFFNVFLGGEAEYTGRDLRSAHLSLVHDKGLSDIHFDRTATHLSDTLQEVGIDEPTTLGLMKIIETLRKEVLDK